MAKGTAAARRARLVKIAEFIHQGLTVRAIAAKCEIAYKTAYEDVQQVLGEMPVPDVTEQRKIAERRLDNLLDKLNKRLNTLELGTTVVGPDGEEVEIAGEVEKTAAAILRVEERRAKLLGLDAPVKAEVQHSNIQISVTNADGV